MKSGKQSALYKENLTAAELCSLFDSLTTDTTVKKLEIGEAKGELTKETMAALSNMIKKNSSLIELDLSALNLLKVDYKEELLKAAIKSNPNLREIILEIDEDFEKFISTIKERNKILIQNIGFLIEQELIPYMLTQNSDLLFYTYSLSIDKILKASPDLSYQSVCNKLTDLKQDLVKHKINYIDMEGEEADPMVVNCLDEVVKRIDEFMQFVDEIKVLSVNSGVNLLHLAAASGLTEQIEKLIKLGGSLNSRDDTGDTPLEYAKLAGLDTTILFLENLTNDNKPNEKDEKKESLQVNDSTKKLYLIFGVEKIEKFLLENQKKYVEGGFAREGYNIIVENLNKYKENLGPSDKAKIGIIIETFSSVPETKAETNIGKNFLECYRISKELANNKIEELIRYVNNAKEGGSCIISTGFDGHEISVLIEKAGDKFVLHIADRGGFLDFTKNEGDKCASIKSLIFDASHLPSVIRKMCEADTLPKDESVQILDKELPRLTNAEYKESNILQSPYKAGICFFGNPKALLRHEFEKHFGATEGKNKYKDFTYLMRSEALKAYEATHSTPDSEELRQEAARILAIKKPASVASSGLDATAAQVPAPAVTSADAANDKIIEPELSPQFGRASSKK